MVQLPSNWLYDPKLGFFENLEQGPFGNFKKQPKYKNTGEPKYEFFGTKVYSPFGIAAGPLPQANFVKSALDRGFDIVTFKTVRSQKYPVHPKPNVFPLKFKQFNSHTPEESYITTSSYKFPLTLANSFGIPSFEPEIWQKEIKKSFALLMPGQALLAAFQGTLQPGSRELFIKDHVKGIGQLRETGARLIEINLSCPNEGHSNLLCFDIKTSTEVLRRVTKTYPDLKLIIKISYFYDDGLLKEFIKAATPYVVGISAINTMQANVIDSSRRQAFKGNDSRLKAGISGAAIKHLAIDMAKRLARHRANLSADFKIIGIGGVQTAADFHELRQAGADYVMALTGVMWNPSLAAEIKQTLKS